VEQLPVTDKAEIRATQPDELAAWATGEWRSWGFRQEDSWRGVLAACDLLAAVEDGEIVGGTASAPFVLTVPGGELPVAGIASVWVSPVRRGEGLFRCMMDAQLTGLVEEGIAASVLIASEAGIYRRFGFGVASLAARLRIDRSGLEGRPGTLSLADRDAGVAAAVRIYERVRPTVPGMLDRRGEWWRYSHPEEEAEEGNPTLFALHGSAAAFDGYAAYSVREGWTAEGRPDNTLLLHELVAETPAAYHALWAYCLGLALCGRVEAVNRPVDEALLHMLDDLGRVHQSVVDGLHLRIFDVEKALSARRYSSNHELVLEVHDDVGGWAGGRFLLLGGVDGAECTSTRRSPALAIDSAGLASVYLGGSSFETLRRAGRVEEVVPGAVKQADGLFSWSPAPWLPWDY